MRSFRKSWIGIVLVFLFSISLFFLRQGSSISNILNSDNVIAEVGSTPISTTRFNRALQMNIQNFNEILGKNLTGEEIKNFQIHELALGAIVNEAVFENEFNNLNYKLDETIIAKKTKELIPQLYNKDNELDENYLSQFLSQQRLKVDDIVQIFHYDARYEYFNSSFLDIYFPISFSNKLENYNKHSRDIEYLKIPINLIDINNLVKNNENKIDNILSEFYKKNISQYMSSEKRDIRYILIDKEDFINSFIPTENEVVEFYKSNTDLYFENEERSFLQFNFKTLSEAMEFKKKIEIITNYKEIQFYADSENIEYNIFDNLTKDELLEDISQSLFTLNLNEQSQVIKSPIAYHIVVLKTIKAARQSRFEESKDDIIKTISNSDVDNFMIDLENQISQDILDSFNLTEIAKKNNLKLSSIKDITKDFNKFDKKNEQFLNDIIKNAFRANLNFINDIVKLNKNEFYIYEVVNISESQPLNFIDIKKNVLDDWKKFKRIEKIDLDIKNNSANSNFLKNLERKYNQKIENLSINSSNTNIPRKLVVDIFKTDLDSITYQVDGNKLHLSKLLKINIEKTSNKANERISLNNEMRNSLYNKLLTETKISTNDQLLESIINSY